MQCTVYDWTGSVNMSAAGRREVWTPSTQRVGPWKLEQICTAVLLQYRDELGASIDSLTGGIQGVPKKQSGLSPGIWTAGSQTMPVPHATNQQSMSVSGDIGDMVYLLQDSVLPLCNAAQLAQIEDHTSEAGREIAADLSPHWKRCMQQEYGLPEEGLEVGVALWLPW